MIPQAGAAYVQFAVQGNTTDTHFSFSQSKVWGISFWDISMYEQQCSGNIVANNPRGCGQQVSKVLKDRN
ncbi:hypothetical protein SG35_012055 [Thalassomonas actiniarum]|uniref:Uncharacterized protein n=1 Tax=Thalassomonas actiniarum TaxID=485447 RepID=A0AAE9YVV8_9GAMM|nr:hypothetical protein SG35_012055 [Thalassomonas actiniarum]